VLFALSVLRVLSIEHTEFCMLGIWLLRHVLLSNLGHVARI
jgi:hypothetical protein